MNLTKILKSVLYILLFVLNVSVINAQNNNPVTGPNRDRETIEAQVFGLISEMPAANIPQLNRLLDEIIDIGPDGINIITSLILPPGNSNDIRARYAIGSLARYSARTGVEQVRLMFSKSMLYAVSQSTDKEVQSFFIEQLQVAGKDEVVPQLKLLLKDERLCEPVTQVFLTIRSPLAEEAIIKELTTAEGINRITLVKAIGEFRSASAAKKIRKLLNTKDPDLYKVSLYALANIADPRDRNLLFRAAEQERLLYSETNAVQAYLLFAKRLGEKGMTGECESICYDLISKCQNTEQIPTKIAALATIFDIKKEKALNELIMAMDDNNKKFRTAALQMALTIPGDDAVTGWMAKVGEVIPEVQAEIIIMLGELGNESAIPVIFKVMRNDEEIIRIAAIRAAGRLIRADAINPLLEVMKSGTNNDVEAVKQELLLINDSKLFPEIIRYYPEVNPTAKVALLEVIAERRFREYNNFVLDETKSKDNLISMAAYNALELLATEKDIPELLDQLISSESKEKIRSIQKAFMTAAEQSKNPENYTPLLLEYLGRVEDTTGIRVIQILPVTGGHLALEMVINYYDSHESELKKATLKAMVNWKDISAAEELLNICKTAADSEYFTTAFKGYVHLVGLYSTGDEQEFEMLKNIMPYARSMENKKLLLQEMGRIKNIEALNFTGKFLDHPDLSQIACRSVISIILPGADRDDGMTGKIAVDYLLKVTGIIKGEESDYERVRILKYLERIPDEEGFVSLFNGRNLDGWVGNKTAYTAEDGAIVIYPGKGGGGNLYTENEYSDFILRFEFQLTPGANNGLGIRAPLRGDAAYVGMELQILDNTDSIYRDLHEYQYHGSVYGVIPAKRGYLKPVGEWNEQEVIAIGPNIKVILNGMTILDGNIEEASKNGTIDGRDHPGLKRTTGHIGFLGHGSVVRFRNIRIKDLTK